MCSQTLCVQSEPFHVSILLIHPQYQSIRTCELVGRPCWSEVTVYHNLAALSKLDNVEDSLPPDEGFLLSI